MPPAAPPPIGDTPSAPSPSEGGGPLPGGPRGSLPDDIADLAAVVAAGEAPTGDEAAFRALAMSDPAVAGHLAAAERLERSLRADDLLPLPLGLVAKVLARVADEPFDVSAAGAPGWAPRSAPDSAPKSPHTSAESAERRPIRILAIAAAALLALGAGLGGLWAATTDDGIRLLASRAEGAASRDASSSGADASAVASSFVELADAARAATPVSVRSLVAVSDQVPGSPAALGAGSLLLLGAAVVGARRRGHDSTTGPQSDGGPSGAPHRAGRSP